MLGIWFDDAYSESCPKRYERRVRYITGGPEAYGKDYKGDTIRLYELGSYFVDGLGVLSYQQKRAPLGPITEDHVNDWPQDEPAFLELRPGIASKWRPGVDRFTVSASR